MLAAQVVYKVFEIYVASQWRTLGARGGFIFDPPPQSAAPGLFLGLLIEHLMIEKVGILNFELRPTRSTDVPTENEFIGGIYVKQLSDSYVRDSTKIRVSDARSNNPGSSPKGQTCCILLGKIKLKMKKTIRVCQ